MDVFNSRLDVPEERINSLEINELEDRFDKIAQSAHTETKK